MENQHKPDTPETPEPYEAPEGVDLGTFAELTLRPKLVGQSDTFGGAFPSP